MTFQHRAGVSPYTSPCGFAQTCVFAKQLLGPLPCGPLAGASLLPRLRDHFAEFLGSASPVGLRILSPSTCVGLRYGCARRHSGFSRRALSALPYSLFGPCGARGLTGPSSLPLPRAARRASPARHAPRARVPASSGRAQCRNLHLLSIGYALRPRLRPRLTQGRRASPWKPRIFGRGDSHPPLATHSGILSSRRSTAPHGAASLRRQRSPTAPLKKAAPRASAACFSPGHFRRGASRLVSCYALFQCVAASGPTS